VLKKIRIVNFDELIFEFLVDFLTAQLLLATEQFDEMEHQSIFGSLKTAGAISGVNKAIFE
jgi:hypothetical protein